MRFYWTKQKPRFAPNYGKSHNSTLVDDPFSFLRGRWAVEGFGITPSDNFVGQVALGTDTQGSVTGKVVKQAQQIF